MSYAASLLANYPTSYAPSSLLSDNLVQRTTYDTIYPSSVPFLNDNRLLSDQLTFNSLNYNPTTTTTNIYQPSLYPSTTIYPTTKRNPIKASTQFSKPLATNQRKTVPPYDSYVSLNDITEYSDSLATASNTNTASTVARSIHVNPKKTFSNHNKATNNQHIWSPVQTKTQKTQAINQKKTPVEHSDDDRTPIPSNQTKQQSNNVPELNQQRSSVDIQAWLNDTKKESPIDDELAQQAWSSKIEHLHQMKAQHEKDKTRSSRALPIQTKKKETKPMNYKTRPVNDNKSTFDSYFDSIFEGDYFRKPFSTENTHNSSLHQPGLRKNKPTTNSFNNDTVKPSKFAQQKKSLQYEPPTIKRSQPTITTSSWRKNWPYHHQYPFESVYPYYLHNELEHREFIQKDAEERYREALQKVRADRAEQQQKEFEDNEKTTKRLNYGDYVRRSTKEGSLQNPIKPSPWSDFMELKKGNVYTISREEKKQLYNQSKNYGERVRYRNFALQYAGETSRSHRHSVPLLDDEYQGSETDGDTSRPPVAKSFSQNPRRPDSAEGHKSRSKSNNTNHNNQNRTSRSNPPAGQFQRRHQSDNESDRESKVTTSKKKTVRYSDNESGNESSDNRSQRNVRMRNHPSNDDLFTLREEKTLETIETSRYKKR